MNINEIVLQADATYAAGLPGPGDELPSVEWLNFYSLGWVRYITNRLRAVGPDEHNLLLLRLKFQETDLISLIQGFKR